MADDKQNKGMVKTMQGDLAAVKNAAKGIVVHEDEGLELLKLIEQKIAEANPSAKTVATVKPASLPAKPQLPIAINIIQPIPVPKAAPQDVKPGLEALPAKATAEGILNGAAIAAEKESKRKAEEQRKRAEELRLAQQKRQREEEEHKRQEALQKAERERHQREEARRRREEQQRQIILEEERKRLLAQQRAERERLAREEQQKKMFEEAEKQRLEKEKQEELIKQQEAEKKRGQEEAERIRQEEAQKEVERLQQQKALPAVLRELKKRIRAHKAELEKELTALSSQEAPLSDKKTQLEGKVAFVADGEFKEAVAAEQEIEAKEEEFLKTGKHKQATLEQEKILSQRLWEIEDRRKLAEKSRWEIEDRIKKLKQDVQEVDAEIVSLAADKTRIRDQIKTLVAQEKLVDFAEWKKGVEEEILVVQEERETLAPALEKANSEKSAAQAAFDQISERHRLASDNLKTAEEKEKEAQDPEVKRTAEKSRWEIENDLRKTTQEKWESEKQLADAIAYEKEQQSKIDKVSARLNSLEDKISAQELVLIKANISPKRLRDQIATFLALNDLEVDSVSLNEITQIDEVEVAPLPPAEEAKNIQPSQEPPPSPAVINQKEPSSQDANAGAEVVVKAVEAAEKKEPVAAVQPQSEAIPAAPAEPKPQPPQPQPQPKPEPKPEPPPVLKKEKPPESPKEAEPEPATENIEDVPVETPVTREQRREPVATLPVSSQSFREPIDDQPVTPFNVPVFPEQTSEPSSSEGEAETPVDAGETVSEGIPEAKEDALETQEQLEGPSLDDRWAQISKANDAVVLPAGEGKTVPGEAQPLKVPRRAKNNQKIIIQILVVLIVLALIGGAGTMIMLSKTQQSIPKTQPKTTVKKPATTPSKPITQKPADNGSGQNPNQNPTQTTPGGAPPSVISTVSNISIITDNLSSIPSLIAPYLTTNRDTDGYYRLLIQDKTNNTYVGLRQVFDIFKIKAPSTLLNNLGDNATLFLYSNRGQNRFGFIASTTNAAGVAQIMKGWENTMEQDTDGLFKYLGKQQPSKQPGQFQNGMTADQQMAYRYIFFQPDSANLGISYAAYRNYFIFTSSVESLTQIINQLPQ